MGGVGGLKDDHHFLYPEVGRAIRRARRIALAEGKTFTPYQAWRTLDNLRKRCHSKTIKDPKGRRPETERPAALEGYLERRRHGAQK